MRLVQGQVGLSWQITRRALTEPINDADPAAAKRAFDAMMEMGKIDIAAIEAAPARLTRFARRFSPPSWRCSGAASPRA